MGGMLDVMSPPTRLGGTSGAMARNSYAAGYILNDVLQAFDYPSDGVQSIRKITTELGRVKFHVTLVGGERLFVGSLPDWPPADHAAASLLAYMRACGCESVSDRVQMACFQTTAQGSYFHELSGVRYLVSTLIDGPCLTERNLDDQQRILGQVIAALHVGVATIPPLLGIPVREHQW